MMFNLSGSNIAGVVSRGSEMSGTREVLHV
jgi:hypothetical protein